MLRRIDPVFDCWFESGAVPYARLHYPFENKEKLERGLPCDFIAEGLDQTRGWFYTLTVLGTHLFGRCPFKNLIVNGLVLAEDGKKMSKRLKNYPDPDDILRKHGADALRLYLVSSPAVRAEPLRFKQASVEAVVKELLLPLYNSFCFLEQSLPDGFVFDPDQKTPLANTTDTWIVSRLNSLIKKVHAGMEEYKLYDAVPPIFSFIDSLTNWYIRFNRKRLRSPQSNSHRVLFGVLHSLVTTAAPFAPFITETIYQKLRPMMKQGDGADTRSVHFLQIPDADEKAICTETERRFARMQRVVEETRMLRETNRLPLKTPLAALKVSCLTDEVRDDILSLQDYIVAEVNVRAFSAAGDMAAVEFEKTAVPNFKILGPKLGAKIKTVSAAVRSLTQDQIDSYVGRGWIEAGGVVLEKDDLEIRKTLAGKTGSVETCLTEEFCLFLDTAVDEELACSGHTRELFSLVQRLRKKAGIVPSQKVSVYIEAPQDSPRIEKTVSMLEKELAQTILRDCPEEDVEATEATVFGEKAILSVSKSPK
ncbi:MAG: isoleucyl-tRNA synthetase [Amphiamblys sp. WSBS2006]|nr:MAG: isoleucyl-tRNA synthetase [Amphiamblys sp. WSBS2006]